MSKDNERPPTGLRLVTPECVILTWPGVRKECATCGESFRAMTSVAIYCARCDRRNQPEEESNGR